MKYLLACEPHQSDTAKRMVVVINLTTKHHFSKQIKVYLNTDGQIQLYSELKCTSDLFTLSAAKRTAEEGEVVCYPH